MDVTVGFCSVLSCSLIQQLCASVCSLDVFLFAVRREGASFHSVIYIVHVHWARYGLFFLLTHWNHYHNERMAVVKLQLHVCRRLMGYELAYYISLQVGVDCWIPRFSRLLPTAHRITLPHLSHRHALRINGGRNVALQRLNHSSRVRLESPVLSDVGATPPPVERSLNYSTASTLGQSCASTRYLILLGGKFNAFHRAEHEIEATLSIGALGVYVRPFLKLLWSPFPFHPINAEGVGFEPEAEKLCVEYPEAQD